MIPQIQRPVGYIYKTTDLKNGKIYIGLHRHPEFDPTYNGSGTIIKSIRKERPEDLRTEVLEWCDTLTELNRRERFWIAFLDSMNPAVGYNRDSGGVHHGHYGKRN